MVVCRGRDSLMAGAESFEKIVGKQSKMFCIKFQNLSQAGKTKWDNQAERRSDGWSFDGVELDCKLDCN